MHVVQYLKPKNNNYDKYRKTNYEWNSSTDRCINYFTKFLRGMGFNIKVIFDAWVAAAKPTPKQSELAQKRLDICIKCPSRKEIVSGKKWSAVCGECGCPISKKIFSQVYDECPLHKWLDVEKEFEHIKPKPIKRDKTLF